MEIKSNHYGHVKCPQCEEKGTIYPNFEQGYFECSLCRAHVNPYSQTKLKRKFEKSKISDEEFEFLEFLLREGRF